MQGTRAKVTLRGAQPTDASELVRLQGSIYAESLWFVGDRPPHAESLVRRLRSVEPDQSLYLVAVADPTAPEQSGEGGEQLCGWLELNRLSPQRLQHVAVLTVAVAAPWRGQGIGRALLRRSYHWARRVGIRKISLNVRAGNDAAIALYRSEGFVDEGRERQQIRTREGYEDNLIMARFLADAHG